MNIYRLVLPLLFILAVSDSQAQVRRGMYSLRGSVSYASMETKTASFTQKTTTFSFSPAFSAFLTDVLEVNWAVNYTDVKTDGSFSTSTYNYNTLLAGLRLYLPLGETALFGGASIGKSERQTRFGYQIEGGLDYFLSPVIALEPVIVHSWDGDDDIQTRETMLYIGFRYFLP